MENTDKYNGWTNRETWAYKLHIDNCAGLQEHFNNLANELTQRELENMLQEELEDMQELVLMKEASRDVMLLLQDVGSTWRVNYREIAENLIEANTEYKKSKPYVL